MALGHADRAERDRLFADAITTDDAWQAELVRVYGSARAGDRRYDRSRNAATPELARLKDLWRIACDAWLDWMRDSHERGERTQDIVSTWSNSGLEMCQHCGERIDREHNAKAKCGSNCCTCHRLMPNAGR